MKVTRVVIRPYPYDDAQLFELSFRDPRRLNPYNVKGITGLDADDLVPQFYGSPGTTNFFNLVMTKREVVALIELNPRYNLNETPSSLRDYVYKMISAARGGQVRVLFYDVDELVALLSGHVTKLEAPQFNQTSEIQMTISCDEPMLKSPSRISVPVATLDPSLTVIIDDISTAPHGFQFELLFESAVTTFFMYDPNDDDWAFEVNPVDGFLPGDKLLFSSEARNKFIGYERGYYLYPMADVIASGSTWPIMFPGENTYAIENGPSMDWSSISYYHTYWGV